MSPATTHFAAPRLRRLVHHAIRPGGTGGTGGMGGTTVPEAGGGRPRQTGHDGPERCDLCAETIDQAHRHLLDLHTGAMSCACRACSLLFDRQEAGGALPRTPSGRYSLRLLPRRRLRLDGCDIDEMLWAGLGIPVDLAFFTRSGSSGEVSAGYPSPLGTMRSTVDPHSWRELEASHPALSTMAEDVEALLVNQAGGAREHWLVPLDDCYRLVAVVRAHWKGLGGGPQVWEQVRSFFDELSTDFRTTTEEASWASP
ncbi:DUF5947 family protein [Streptomyces sp. 8N616]|uniref:DUF5947 family protein n=1 Tax=Streptomyces sp. 8N616 TaxID=3457414 RepID=UPI003FD288DE